MVYSQLTLRKFKFILSMLLALPALLSAQSMIKGTVLDESDQPLIGVSVQVKGTFTGTVTDIDGKYMIEAGSKDILVFTYIGYSGQEVPVNNQTEVNLKMLQASEELQEVIVTALGVKKESKRMGYSA